MFKLVLEKVEEPGIKLPTSTGSDFIFGGSKITADGDCSHEIRRRLLLGRKVMTNLDSIFKKTLLCQQRSVWSRLWFLQWSRMDVRVGLWSFVLATPGNECTGPAFVCIQWWEWLCFALCPLFKIFFPFIIFLRLSFLVYC